MKFKSQLRRTRPDIIRQIDESIARAIINAGGKITGDRFVSSAVFKEDTIGFWLDIYILIENIKKSIEASAEFYGYSLVISGKLPDSPELLTRFLANNGGIFTDEKSAKRLLPYASFEKPSEWMKNMKTRKYGCGSYYRIRELKVFKSGAGNDLELQKHVFKIYKQDNSKNTLILGPSFVQMRSALGLHCSNINDDFPPLKVCFESIGLGCVVDIWSQDIRALEKTEPALLFSGSQSTEEIDNLWEFLFRERIRNEISEYVIRCARRFLFLVFDFYLNAARRKNKTPVLALENIHLAESNAMILLIDALAEINQKHETKFLVLGTGEDDIPQNLMARWEAVFDNVKKIDDIKSNSLYYPKLSVDLWEIIYAISLFSRYYSPELFLRLFEEDDKNPVMIKRAFSILHSLGIIDSMREPRLVKRRFEDNAHSILNGKEYRINEMVRGRLLNWAVKQNLNPCFRLLLIIAELDGVKQIDDLLLLKSFSSDIVNKTTNEIEAAITSGRFEELVEAKAPAMRHIYKTSKALLSGCQKDIENAFIETQLNNLLTDCESFPVLKVQMVVNLCAYYLGRHDVREAAEKAKEAILLGQSKNLFCLPQGYRLFSLVCLAKQQINETIEYLGFALTNAEKSGNNHELAISAYYMAAAQFLYGDIYNAAHLARKSIEQSLSAGHPDWADRSRFLEGRLELELGHYKEALKIFEGLHKEPYGSMTCEKENLLAAWIYRSKVYCKDPLAVKPEGAVYDADLFEIEAAYLSGDYKKALELSTSLKNPFSGEGFLYTEQADWRSGFAQCEHLYFTNGEIQNRIINLFHALALSKLTPKGSDEAVHVIQQILRDERLCEMDPWDAFYFYAKYRILEQSGASHVDMSTAVSMAFKRLQRRAGRIEDIETRRQYLNGPRWNRELSAAAKEFKLI
ncbi:MAG: hypothetical protein FWD40_08015 [Treponema sp.]|nr:hypothetical protein [Treponema sp.]